MALSLSAKESARLASRSRNNRHCLLCPQKDSELAMEDAVPFGAGRVVRLEAATSEEADYQAGFGNLDPSLPGQRVHQDGRFLPLNFQASVRPHFDLGTDHLDVVRPKTHHRVCGLVAENVRTAEFQALRRPGASGRPASSNVVAVP